MGCYLWQVESSDLISYGLIPEFVGRFPVLVSFSALTEDQLVQVNTIFVLQFEILSKECHLYFLICSKSQNCLTGPDRAKKCLGEAVQETFPHEWGK